MDQGINVGTKGSGHQMSITKRHLLNICLIVACANLVIVGGVIRYRILTDWRLSLCYITCGSGAICATHNPSLTIIGPSPEDVESRFIVDDAKTSVRGCIILFLGARPENLV